MEVHYNHAQSDRSRLNTLQAYNIKTAAMESFMAGSTLITTQTRIIFPSQKHIRARLLRYKEQM